MISLIISKMCSKPNVFLLLFLMSTLTPFSNGTNDYKICSSPCSCGPLTDIRYPFWVEQTTPGFCGLPDFKLNCQNVSDYPRMWMIQKGKWYTIRSINTSNHTIVVSQDDNETCQDVGKSDQDFNSKNESSSPFKLGTGIEQIALFYNCPNTTRTRFPNMSCSSNEGNVSIYYFGKDAQSGGCNNTVKFPVLKRSLDEMISNEGKGMTLEGVLGDSFEVGYNFANLANCSACKNSGGVCVSSFDSSSNELVCYHPEKRRHLGLILGLGIALPCMLTMILVAFCFREKLKLAQSNVNSRSLNHDASTSDIENGSLYFGVPLFSYKDLEEATDNFDESRELGDGGFGRVYYGKLRDGREVAVKQLYEKSYKRIKQFMNEVQILTCLRHQNLVSLYGCTSPQCRELLLVYEYIRNGTVADHLYGDMASSGYLSWGTRMRIAIETATALSYLHASDIIHRDVKTYNILLDGNFSVKVADFGLSRLFPTDVTHVSTAPQGTPGYVDPEYNQCYQLTAKSDVYSFGVVLIELISSLPAVDMKRERQEINLSNYAMNRIQRCAYDELVDSRLGFGSDFRIRKMVVLVAELAFQCLQHEKEFRPAMDEVLEELSSIESGNYNDEFEAKDHKEVRSRTNIVQPSPTSVLDRSGSKQGSKFNDPN